MRYAKVWPAASPTRSRSGLPATAAKATGSCRKNSVLAQSAARPVGVAKDQSRTVLSPPAEAKYRPSGVKTTQRTGARCPAALTNSRPVPVSQTFTVPSRLAEAKQRPSRENATAVQHSRCLIQSARRRSVAASRSFTVLSQPAEASQRPSAEIATLMMPCRCPRQLATIPPEGTAQSRSTRSTPPESKYRPWKVMQVTASRCPTRSAKSRPVNASQILIVPSTAAEAR